MSNKPNLSTGSEIESYLNTLPDWPELMQHKNLLNLEQIKLFLLEYPDYINQIMSLPAFIKVGNAQELARVFLAFASDFPSETQQDENAVCSLYSMNDFALLNWEELSNLLSIKVPSLIWEIVNTIGMIANDGGGTNGIHFWLQVRLAILQMIELNKQEGFTQILNAYSLSAIDSSMLDKVKQVVRRDAIYSGGLPWEDEEAQEQLNKLQLERKSQIYKSLQN